MRGGGYGRTVGPTPTRRDMPSKKQTRWKKVKAPTAWAPVPGEALVARYVRAEPRSGYFGQYTAHIFTQGGDLYSVTGCVLDSLMRDIPTGTLVKVVFAGDKPTIESGHLMKMYEVFVEEDEEAAQ
jgi:hypothetical protein